ncbi:MAG: hypothetical protein ACOCRK_03295 [bacterium]
MSLEQWEKELESRVSEIENNFHLLCQIYLTTEEYNKLKLLLINGIKKDAESTAKRYPLSYCRILSEIAARSFIPYGTKYNSGLCDEFENRLNIDVSKYYHQKIRRYFLKEVKILGGKYKDLILDDNAGYKYVEPLILHGGIPVNFIHSILDELQVKEKDITEKDINNELIFNIFSNNSIFLKKLIKDITYGKLMLKQLVKLYNHLKTDKERIIQAKILSPSVIDKVVEYIEGTNFTNTEGIKTYRIKKEIYLDDDYMPHLLLDINYPEPACRWEIRQNEEEIKNGILEDTILDIPIDNPIHLNANIFLSRQKGEGIYCSKITDKSKLLIFSADGKYIYPKDIVNGILEGIYIILVHDSISKELYPENLNKDIEIYEHAEFRSFAWLKLYSIHTVRLKKDTKIKLAFDVNTIINVSVEMKNNSPTLSYFKGKTLYCWAEHRSFLGRKILLFGGVNVPELIIPGKIKKSVTVNIQYYYKGNWNNIKEQDLTLEIKEDSEYTVISIYGEKIEVWREIGCPVYLKYIINDFDIGGIKKERRILWLPRANFNIPTGLYGMRKIPNARLNFGFIPNSIDSSSGLILEKESSEDGFSLKYQHYKENSNQLEACINLTYSYDQYKDSLAIKWKNIGVLNSEILSDDKKIFVHSSKFNIKQEYFNDPNSKFLLEFWPLLPIVIKSINNTSISSFSIYSNARYNLSLFQLNLQMRDDFSNQVYLTYQNYKCLIIYKPNSIHVLNNIEFLNHIDDWLSIQKKHQPGKSNTTLYKKIKLLLNKINLKNDWYIFFISRLDKLYREGKLQDDIYWQELSERMITNEKYNG